MGGFYSNALVVVVLPHQDLHGLLGWRYHPQK